MTLFEFIKTVKTIATKSKYVNEVAEGDVYENLNSGDHTYPFVNLTIDNITTEDETSTVAFNLFYIDRLTSDNKNKTQIQSFGVTVLSQIFNQLEEYYNIDFTSKIYTPFTEQFADLCAGCYATCNVAFTATEICVKEGSFESKTISIKHNGSYDITGYDQADVNVSAVGAIDYYWIMPYNQGVPNISLSDLTSTFEIKFRRYTDTTTIYDDGYTSLIYEDNQFKARLNGGEWLETLVRETDVKTHTVKLTGTKLQIDYYTFDLVDGGHKWDYNQLYIGPNIDVFYCKYIFANGGVASDYEPYIVNGAACLKDKVDDKIMNITTK